MSAKKKKKISSHERIREIAWDIGQRFPVPMSSDYVALSIINPHSGYVHWHVRNATVKRLRKKKDGGFASAHLVVRVYDVTDIIFDGQNAHSSFDIDVNTHGGNFYFDNHKQARIYVAEIGLRGGGGSFHPFARSNTAYFDLDRPSGNYQISGLYVRGALNRTFPVENIFDAPVYERMNQNLAGIRRKEALSIAVVFLLCNQAGDSDDLLGSFIEDYSQKFRNFGGEAKIFIPQGKDIKNDGKRSLMNKVRKVSDKVYDQLIQAHKNSPFHIVHSHDWYSSGAGLKAAKQLKLPLVLSLHSTEYERTRGNVMDRLSTQICSWEKRAVKEADLVIVPHSSTRQQVVSLYGAPPEKVVIIPDVLGENKTGILNEMTNARQWFGLPPDVPVILFAGEVSHASGADLLMDALPTVCRNHRNAHFVFAGEGPLKGELESRTYHSGIGHRCRFLGHINRKTFEAVLMSSDFVVIPARTWQDEGLAQMAIEYGRPVLTTHQSGINCIVHGKTGLVTFDNPGSIVWGLQEMLFNPLKESMLCMAARKSATETPSLENIAVQHYMYYEITLKNFRGGGNV